MALTDGDIAALAREAVDRRGQGIAIRIVPADPVDPYRRGAAAWTVLAGGASSYVTADLSYQDALAKLIADLAPAEPE